MVTRCSSTRGDAQQPDGETRRHGDKLIKYLTLPDHSRPAVLLHKGFDIDSLRRIAVPTGSNEYSVVRTHGVS